MDDLLEAWDGKFIDPNMGTELELPNEDPTPQAPPFLENESEIRNDSSPNDEGPHEEFFPRGYPIRVCCKGNLGARMTIQGIQGRLYHEYSHRCIEGTSSQACPKFASASSNISSESSMLVETTRLTRKYKWNLSCKRFVSKMVPVLTLTDKIDACSASVHKRGRQIWRKGTPLRSGGIQ